jgi:hypothetical protein
VQGNREDSLHAPWQLLLAACTLRAGRTSQGDGHPPQHSTLPRLQSTCLPTAHGLNGPAACSAAAVAEQISSMFPATDLERIQTGKWMPCNCPVQLHLQSDRVECLCQEFASSAPRWSPGIHHRRSIALHERHLPAPLQSVPQWPARQQQNAFESCDSDAHLRRITPPQLEASRPEEQSLASLAKADLQDVGACAFPDKNDTTGSTQYQHSGRCSVSGFHRTSSTAHLGLAVNEARGVSIKDVLPLLDQLQVLSHGTYYNCAAWLRHQLMELTLCSCSKDGRCGKAHIPDF